MTAVWQDLGGGLDLVVADHAHDAAVLAVTVRNLERLRPWEPWAAATPTLASTRAFTSVLLRALADGSQLPLRVRRDGAVLGSVGLRFDPRAATGELGYWVDSALEGTGAAFRACAAVVEHAHGTLALDRVVIRTGARNERSRRLAERLGFALQRIEPDAIEVQDALQDVAVYAHTR